MQLNYSNTLFSKNKIQRVSQYLILMLSLNIFCETSGVSNNSKSQSQKSQSQKLHRQDPRSQEAHSTKLSSQDQNQELYSQGLDEPKSCAATGSNCLADSDCCAGDLCDNTADLNQCVSCLVAEHNCAGLSNRCCSDLICDTSGVCVVATDDFNNCPDIGAACLKYSDCGGTGCNFVCDELTHSCQICGSLGTTCAKTESCCPNLVPEVASQVRCDLVISHTCCLDLGATCEKDQDCCADIAGTVKCVNNFCKLTDIFTGQLCGASLDAQNSPLANSSTPCLQDDPYNRPITCLPVTSNTGDTVHLCGASLISAGQTCTEITTVLDGGISVSYNYCAGWESDSANSRAACLPDKIDPTKKSCCALASGICTTDQDCCDSSLVCNQLGQCAAKVTPIPTPPTGNQFIDDPWAIAALATGGTVIILVLITVIMRKQIRRGIAAYEILDLINSSQTIFKLKASQLIKIYRAYPAEFFAADCTPAVRKKFIDAFLDVLKDAYPSWNNLLEQAGLNEVEFRANLSVGLQLMMQQATGRPLNWGVMVPGITAAATTHLAGYLPELLSANLRTLGVSEPMVEFVLALSQPEMARGMNLLATRMLTSASANMNSDSVGQEALVGQSLKALKDLFAVVKLNVTHVDQSETSKAYVRQLDAAITILETVLSRRPVLPGGAAASAAMPVVDPIVQRAAKLLIDQVYTNIKANSDIQRLRDGGAKNITTIDAAFNADPVDFAKLYFIVIAELAATPGEPVASDTIIKKMRDYCPELFTDTANLAPESSFLTLFQAHQAVLVAAGSLALGLNLAELVPAFKSWSTDFKQLVVTASGTVKTAAQVAGLSDAEIRDILERSIPLLTNIELNVGGRSVSLVSLAGHLPPIGQEALNLFSQRLRTWFEAPIVR